MSLNLIIVILKAPLKVRKCTLNVHFLTFKAFDVARSSCLRSRLIKEPIVYKLFYKVTSNTDGNYRKIIHGRL